MSTFGVKKKKGGSAGFKISGTGGGPPPAKEDVIIFRIPDEDAKESSKLPKHGLKESGNATLLFSSFTST